MKISFKIGSKMEHLYFEAAGLPSESTESNISSLEELCSIEFSDLNTAQITGIKAASKTIVGMEAKDNIPILKELSLLVRSIEEQEIENNYTLTMYLEPLVWSPTGALLSQGNFEFLLDFKNSNAMPGLTSCYLNWRKTIVEQFPEAEKLLQREEQLAPLKAELFRYQCGLKVRNSAAKLGLLSWLGNNQQTIMSENEQIKQRINELTTLIDELEANKNSCFTYPN